jgi:hypothetical protein
MGSKIFDALDGRPASEISEVQARMPQELCNPKPDKWAKPQSICNSFPEN